MHGFLVKKVARVTVVERVVARERVSMPSLLKMSTTCDCISYFLLLHFVAIKGSTVCNPISKGVR